MDGPGVTSHPAQGAETSTPPWTGNLVLRVECRSEPRRPTDVRHQILIHDDWSIETPHDLDAERVAMAFGGYCSCVELVDRTLPRLRDSLARVTRRTRPALRRGKRLEWRGPIRELGDCCNTRGFASVRMITEHLRGAAHLSKVLGLPQWQVETVVQSVTTACRPDLTGDSANARWVREEDGLKDLWRSGIHPDHVPALAAFASSVDEPLPVSYFEGVAYSGHPTEWMDDVLRYRPDAETAAWLAWQEPPDVLAAPTTWGEWLGFGVSRSDFLVALGEGIPPGVVLDVCAATGWSKQTAARIILDWARVGCRPTPEHFAATARRGVDHSRPGGAAIDLAAVELGATGPVIERTELGIMLALVGSRPELIAAVRHGARTANDL